LHCLTSGTQWGAAAGAVDVTMGSPCELVVGLRVLVLRGICASRLCLSVELQRAGDEFRGVDAAGLEDLEELAMNLSRKCCSQSAEGIVAGDLV
jgi:hypothetical protein